MSAHSAFGFVLSDVARLFRKRFERKAREIDLTRSQWHALVYLSRHEGINQVGLANILEVKPVTLMRILDKLESSNLVDRRRDQNDRRLKPLFLTDRARQILFDARDIGESVRTEALDGVCSTEQDMLFDALIIMKANLLNACGAAIPRKESGHG